MGQTYVCSEAAGIDELLDDWHRFDDERTREALLEWCKDAGVPIEE